MPEDATHQRLKRQRGKALGQPCVGCGGTAVEWAYQHGGDPEDLTGYSPMCRSCHRTLDYSKGTPVPPCKLTLEQRSKGGKNSTRRTHAVGCNRALLYTGECRCGARKRKG